ncbi:MAG: DUF362 domain-containing protein [Acidobacteriota bacterium]
MNSPAGKEVLSARRVVVARTSAVDGWGTPPYHPPPGFPERRGRAAGDNRLYAAVRQVLAGLQLDADRCGREEWNPFRALVSPGASVVIKPNLVRHRHGRGGWLATVVTDPRLTRAVLDFAVDAVAPGGTVTLADSPLQSCDFEALSRSLALREMTRAAAHSGVQVRILDFRREEVTKGDHGLITGRRPLSGDPSGYVAIDLGACSALRSLESSRGRFRVTQYAPEETTDHHDGARHEYLIPRSLLAADLVINLPKIKTHRKAGMTGALKNLVGINGSKAWLPHHRAGAVTEGGDEYQRPSLRKRCMSRIWERMDRTSSLWSRRLLGRVESFIRRTGRLVPFPDPYFEGSWWGNMTMPAMVADLNRIFVYADAEGRMSERPVRRQLVIADAVIAGEGEGPLEPSPRSLGALIGGGNPVAVDWVAAAMMGLDPRRIPVLTRCVERDARPLLPVAPEETRVFQAGAAGVSRERSLEQVAAAVVQPFVPAAGWKGHIEASPASLDAAGRS